METLEVKKENALKAYDEANDKGKTLLTNLFGKQVFEREITGLVKTFEDACNVLGVGTEIEVDSPLTTLDDKSAVSYLKLIIIARALNEGWEPDWNNSNEYKYYPWFKMKSGFGFSHCDYSFSNAGTDVGSRLCFKTAELAEYAGKQFEAIYQDYLSL